MGELTPLFLNGSLSVDPDSSHASGNMTFSWTCRTAQGAACRFGAGSAWDAAAATQNVTLTAGQYVFTLVVSRDTRSDSTSANVLVSGAGVPSVLLLAPSDVVRVARNTPRSTNGSAAPVYTVCMT